MKNTVLIIMLSSLVLLNCDKNNVTASDENNFDVTAFGMIDVDAVDIELMTNESLAKGASTDLHTYEVRLKYFAKGIAKLLNDPEIGAYLKDEIGKQFDGDYDVLWETVAEKDFAQKGKFKNILRELYKSDIDMINQFNSVPLLQVSAPVHFEKWNVGEPLLVAYNPITKDDMEWEEIEAFDADGKKIKLDAKSVPDSPVIVVGLNERINLTTGKLYSFVDASAGGHTPLARPPGGGGGNGGGGSSGDDLRIKWVVLDDDKEPWWKGDPEVYYLFVNGSTYLEKYYYNEFDDNSWHNFDKQIMYWHDGDDEDRSYIRWMEHDFGILWTDWTCGGHTFSINNSENDDDLGSATFHRDDPTSSQSNPYTTGNSCVRFTITWN